MGAFTWWDDETYIHICTCVLISAINEAVLLWSTEQNPCVTNNNDVMEFWSAFIRSIVILFSSSIKHTETVLRNRLFNQKTSSSCYCNKISTPRREWVLSYGENTHSQFYSFSNLQRFQKILMIYWFYFYSLKKNIEIFNVFRNLLLYISWHARTNFIWFFLVFLITLQHILSNFTS